MAKDDIEKIKLHILKKLFDQRCWMHKHFNINNIPQGLPPHKRDSRIIKKAVDDLIHNNWIIAKPTHYGLELSLNINKKKEIEEFIERNL